MAHSEAIEIFSAIKSDDQEAFGKLMRKKKTNLELSLGRFPLLSLCYLYKSKRIVRAFEGELASLKSYKTLDYEPIDAYLLFKEYALKSLKLYVFGEERIVSPLEMLAIVGETSYLEGAFNKLSRGAREQENLEKICKNSNYTLTQSEDKLKISQPLTRFQQSFLLCVGAGALAFILLISILLGFVGARLGFGTSQNPAIISSERTLLAAFDKKDKYFVIEQDITLEGGGGAEFLAHLDGGGHTITLKNASFIEVLKGSIKNVHFLVESTLKIEDSGAMVIKKNEGKISNVSINFDLNLSEDTINGTVFSALVSENFGTIEDSKAEGKLSFSGNGIGAAAFAFFAGTNSGSIINCSTLSQSRVSVKNVDIAAIAVENKKGGVVKDCVNNADFVQTNTNESRYPNASGIVALNYGIVSNSMNAGDIKVLASGSSQDKFEIYVGGIVSLNDGTIERCISDGDLWVDAINAYIFAGGISGVNANLGAVVASSGSFGQIAINCPVEDAPIFGGGITGFSWGAISDSFSAMTYASTSVNANFGGIIGLGYFAPNNLGYFVTMNKNNYYVARTSVLTSVAMLYVLTESGYQFFEGVNENTTLVSSLASLKQLDIYWEYAS